MVGIKTKEEQGGSHTEQYNLLQVLSGRWELVCDPENEGKNKKWFLMEHVDGAQEAPVPGIIQQVFPDYHGVVWYSHIFTPQIYFAEQNSYLLKFSFVDYYMEIWMNGVFAGSHEGGEMPFKIDVTGLIKQDEHNVLAIRLVNPTEEVIDGFVLDEVPHRCKFAKGINFGKSYNYGGIIRQVELVSVPKARIENIFVQADAKTEKVRIDVEIVNCVGIKLEGKLRINLKTRQLGYTASVFEDRVTLLTGKTIYKCSLTVLNPHLWDINDPYLYEAVVELETMYNEKKLSNCQKTCFGFRDFHVENGFFRLNGKRIFLRSTHTINHYPQGQIFPVNPGFLQKDLIYAKASGFNMVRFIAGTAFPEQLDLCDEIGLMVYEECYAAWNLANSPKMTERFDESTLGMIKRDRNHPCITIWGLLNETANGEVFSYAVSVLEKVRMFDTTRLVLLGSGRWDRQMDIGSVCNPGSLKWEFEWGEEAPDNKTALEETWCGLFKGMGDIHYYPAEPKSKEDISYFRNAGNDSKPVFLSETGVGSQFDLIRSVRHYEQAGARFDLPDFSIYRAMEEKFLNDWSTYGMDGVYPFPGDMLRDSQVMQTRLREHLFSIIRSNPRYSGYNLTGMLDQVFLGEGLWTFFREWKPGIVDVLQDGWAPLRWCLFTSSQHVYAGRPFEVEAVLANEDVLKPGKYPVCFKISGSGGVLWEKESVLCIPETVDGEDGPLAVQVISESVILESEPGVYEFSACLLRGGAPCGGRHQFYLSDTGLYPPIGGEIVLWGVDEKISKWLSKWGIACKDLADCRDDSVRLILIGNLTKTEAVEADWEGLLNMVTSGSTAVFLCPETFVLGEDTTGWLPLMNRGSCKTIFDWLYHKECIAKEHPYFKDLYKKGIMDNDYYDQVIPHKYFEALDTPDETIAAAFAAGYFGIEGYFSGILTAAYKKGAGRLVINTLRILENIDSNPAADMLLLNIISYELQMKCIEP